MRKYTPTRASSLDRREMLQLVGAGVAASTTVGLAGCQEITGSDGADEDEEFQAEIDELDFGANYRERRGASLEEWPREDRLAVPTDDVGSSDAWLESDSVRTAPWSPPEGWEDTPAADVDEIRILNYGDMQFDPATAAVHALFERETGISVVPVEVPLDQAIPKAAASLSSGEASPHVLQATASSSMTTYAGRGWIEPADYLMPDEEMWEMHPQRIEDTYQWDGHLWGGPGTDEAALVHVRVDMLEEQGLEDELEAIRDGTWTWAELESVMEAFEDEDEYGFAFRGGSTKDTEQDWRTLMYQAGDEYVNDDGTVTIDEGGLLALEKLVEWRENGWLPPESVFWDEGDLGDAFLSGNLATCWVSTYMIPDIVEQFERDEEYIIARMPRASEGPDPRHATYAGGPVSAVNAHASVGHKIAGAIYQDCRFSVASGWWEYVHEENISPQTDVYEQGRDELWMAETREQVIEDGMNETFAEQRAIVQRISDEVQEAYAGEKEPTAAIESAQTYIDQVLDQ